MSLRIEIHAAIDEVGQPTPALRKDVMEFVRTAGRPKPERESLRTGRWSLGIRRAGALVAAALVVALMATLIVGGRVWRDWGGSATNPSSASGQAQLAKLHARPLNLPVLAPGADCPDGPYSNVVWGSGGPPLALGMGPAYVYVGTRTPTSWGTYFDLAIFVDPRVSGLLLVRGQNLDNGLPVVFAGDSAAGKVLYTETFTSTDPVTGERIVDTVNQRPELVLEPSHRQIAEEGGLGQSYAPFQVWWNWLGVANNATMCIALQIDGPGFSEVVVSRK